MKLAIIGYGTIAKLALETIAAESGKSIGKLIIVARPQTLDRAGAMREHAPGAVGASMQVVSNIADLLALGPNLVAEAAGHQALHDYCPSVLRAGIDVIVASAGALASTGLRDALDKSAAAGGSRYEIIPGAVGGMDILAAAKLSGLVRVMYRSRKPPAAWRGTAAEQMTDLNDVSGPVVFFKGNAGDAARLFPQNANVAATIALQGAGFEATRVELIADPSVARNVHELDVQAGSADFTIRIEGRAAPENPKTSLTTAYSLARSILNRM